MRERIKEYTHYLIFALCALLLLYLFYKYALNIIMPFLISYAFAFFIRSVSNRVERIVKLPTRLMRFVLSLLFFVLLLLVACFSIYKLLQEGIALISNISKNDISSILSVLSDPINKIFGEDTIPRELSAKISDWLYSALSGSLGDFVSGIGNTALYIPKLLLAIFITLISTIYFAMDLEHINAYLKRILPRRVSFWLVELKGRFKSVGIKYIRAYLIIMLLVFSIMLFGLSVIGVEYALIIALVLALLDMLPLIGIGTVMIPWAIILIIFGDLRVGISLIVLFVICEIIRQIVEPRIIGKNLGLHPLVTLILMYVGFSAFGLFGILLTPLFTVLLEVLINKDNTAKVG